MSNDDLRDKVRNWFQAQTRHIAPPMITSSLASVIARRLLQSPAEITVREKALRTPAVPLPPPELIDWVGGGDEHVFQTVGLLNFWQLMAYCELRSVHRVLEPGCGCGRNARYIAPYLAVKGGWYAGFDVHRASIDWATDAITTKYPNCRFAFVDIRNSNYNPHGSVRDFEYVFPYESQSFDLVFLPSVFTHLTRPGFEQYLHEIARVLVPGGRLLSWHFLLDGDARRLIADGESTLPFHSYDDVSWTMDVQNPCAAVAFDETYVLETMEGAGLRPQFLSHGTWCGRIPDGLVDAQDRVLAVRS